MNPRALLKPIFEYRKSDADLSNVNEVSDPFMQPPMSLRRRRLNLRVMSEAHYQ
jgi:hypothetical protein